MRIFELFESGPATTTIGQDMHMSGSAALSGAGRFTADDDQVEKTHFGDTRKPKITLKMLNKLKMIRAAKKLEIIQKQKVLSVMYGLPPAGSEDGAPI
jgi:hypothetical protein